MRVAAAALVALLLSSVVSAQTRYPPLEQEPACQTLMPAAAGGPLPQNPDVVVLRFLGVSNYELAYRDKVVLLDAAIDKLAWWAPNNITTDGDDQARQRDLRRPCAWRAPVGCAVLGEKTTALVVGDPISYALGARHGPRHRQEDGGREEAKGGETSSSTASRSRRSWPTTTSCPNEYMAEGSRGG